MEAGSFQEEQTRELTIVSFGIILPVNIMVNMAGKVSKAEGSILCTLETSIGLK